MRCCSSSIVYTRDDTGSFIYFPPFSKCMFRCGHDIEGMVEGGLTRRGKWKSADAGTEAREDIMASVAVLESGADRLAFCFPSWPCDYHADEQGGMTGLKKNSDQMSRSQEHSEMHDATRKRNAGTRKGIEASTEEPQQDSANSATVVRHGRENIGRKTAGRSGIVSLGSRRPGEKRWLPNSHRSGVAPP